MRPTMLLALVAALALAAPALAAPRRFSGRTAQDMPISFRLSADRHRVDHVSLGYYAICDEEIAIAQSEARETPAPVARDGSFTVRVSTRIVISGRFTGRQAAGTIRIRYGIGRNACPTPVVRWTARG